jgi:hypothetical protein
MNHRVYQQLNDLADFAFPIALEVNRSQKHVSLILDKKGNMLSYGQNAVRTHPKAAKYGYRFDEVHSELDAFLKVPRHLRSGDLTLINYRFNRFGELRKSRPCHKCLLWCRAIFKNIIYTNDDSFHLIGHNEDHYIKEFQIRSKAEKQLR